MKIPKEFNDTKSKIAYWIFSKEYIFNQGRVVAGKVSTLMVDAMAFLFLVEKFGYEPKPNEIIFLVVIGVVGCYVLGYFWTKHKADKISTIVSQERNPLLNDLHQALDKDKKEKF